LPDWGCLPQKNIRKDKDSYKGSGTNRALSTNSHMKDYQKVEDHFDELKTTLEKRDNEDKIKIIDYLIKFLGCLTLSVLIKKYTENQLLEDGVISKLTAGRWASLIEKWVSKYAALCNIPVMTFIKNEFFRSEGGTKLSGYIYRWIDIRNTLAHDTIITDNEELPDLSTDIDSFATSLLRVVQKYIDIIQKPFFYFQNNTLYIYSELDQKNNIKYTHYRGKPIVIDRADYPDFPLSHRAIFLSLSPTPADILIGKDAIKIEMKTLHPKNVYKNHFELWINKQCVEKFSKSYVDKDTIEFASAEFTFDDGKTNEIEVRALKKGEKIASDIKRVTIYSKVPDARILWEWTEAKRLPLSKVSTINLSVQSVFEIKDIEIDSLEAPEFVAIFGEKPVFSKKDSRYIATFNVLPTEIGKSILKVHVSYTDKIGAKKMQSINLQIICIPNFFEPDFEGEDRRLLIKEILSKRKNYLIIGEGGIGKSRLIQEIFDNIKHRHEYQELTASPFIPLAIEFGEILDIKFSEEDKPDEKRSKIIEWFKKEAKSGIEKTFWVKDCHEISEDNERIFLKTIAKICSSSGNHVTLLLEARDKTWSKEAKKLIEEIKTTDAEIIQLARFKDEEMMNIIDSIFKPNEFDISLKRYLISKSDGIIYILLEYLKHLFDEGYFKWDEGEIWLAKPFSEIEELLRGMNFNKVLKMNIDDCLAILDNKGLGDKGRDLLRYLYFKNIHVYILKELLELDLHDLQYVLDVFENNYIIKKQLEQRRWLDLDKHDLEAFYDIISSDEVYLPKRQWDRQWDKDSVLDAFEDEGYDVIKPDYVYEFHHQLKAEYCFESYLSNRFISDYFIMVAKHYKSHFGYDILFDGIYLRDEFRDLSEPHLKEKLHFLLLEAFDYVCPEASLDVLYKYESFFTVEEILQGIEEALFSFRILRAHNFSKRYVDFYSLKKTIDYFFDKRNLDDLTPYDNRHLSLYYFVKYRIEIEELIQHLREEYGIRDYRESIKFDELFIPIFKFSDGFLRNEKLLKETYDKLYNILSYFEFDPEQIYFYHGYHWQGQDIYKSIAHISGLLMLAQPYERERLISEYLDYFIKLFFLPYPIYGFRTEETIDFFKFHKKYFLKDYPEILNIISYNISYIIDKKVELNREYEHVKEILGTIKREIENNL
jgi:hypothetical protein